MLLLLQLLLLCAVIQNDLFCIVWGVKPYLHSVSDFIPDDDDVWGLCVIDIVVTTSVTCSKY